MQKELVAQINHQINREFFSAYLYLDIANYYASKSLSGFSNWFQVQAMEEKDHALMLIAYLRDQDEEIVLSGIAAPSTTFKTIKEPLEISYAHEKSITQAIHTIYENAMDLKDYRLIQCLNWFIEEQSEEEKSAKDLLDKLSIVGEQSAGLYVIDAELKMRSYTPSHK